MEVKSPVPRFTVPSSPWNAVDAEFYHLLEYCVKKNDITEWNIQYSRYLLGHVDILIFHEPEYKTPYPAHPAVVPPKDTRADLSRNGILHLNTYIKEKGIEVDPLLIKLICWAYLPDYVLSNQKEVAEERNSYLKRIRDAIDNAKMNNFSINPLKKRAHLQGIKVTGDRLFKVAMDNIILSYATLVNASFSYVTMCEADLQHSYCFNATFDNVSLMGANISQSNFIISTISNSDWCDLIGCDTDFTDAKISNTRITSSSMSQVPFVNTETGMTLYSEYIYHAGVNLSRSNFTRSKLTNVLLMGANLNDAIFYQSTLINTNISAARLQGATFILAGMDSDSVITGDLKTKPEMMVDDFTDFTGASLNSVRIDPKLRTILQKNIRCNYWKKWYSNHKIIQYPVRIFWWVSDYGTTCKKTIIGLILLFAASVLNHCFFSENNNIPEIINHSLISIFGFGGTYLSGAGLVIGTLISIVGYFLLAILITRFAVMFQSLTP